MKIGIATDHNGVNEKKIIIDHLRSFGVEVVDYSPENYDTDDYPVFAFRVANAVKDKQVDEGILLCGTGIGMSIAANKIHGIRCARITSVNDAHFAKFHNNANMIAMSYKEDIKDILDMVDEFIKTDFAKEERHVRRIKMIEDIDHD